MYRRELGFYRQDTRYLDTWELSLNGEPLTTLAHNRTNLLSTYFFVMTNRDMESLDESGRIPRDMIHVFRRLCVTQDTVIEKITIMNYDVKPHQVEIKRRAASSFNDIFEVRGMQRSKRGTIEKPHHSPTKGTVSLHYHGLDNKEYITEIWCSRSNFSEDIEDDGVSLSHKTEIATGVPYEITYIMRFLSLFEDSAHSEESSPTSFTSYSFEENTAPVDQIHRLEMPTISCDNPILSEAISRAIDDLETLATRRGGILYPDAGIPWFCAPFGRDGIISAYQLLPWCPDLAAGVLEKIFSTLGTKFDPETDEEPGKAFHEQRFGEMARNAEVPFRPYFGSVDATPLALILFGEYAAWTRRIDFVYRWWESACIALQWVLGRLNSSEESTILEGFLTYKAATPKGLRNQGWKDSHDAVIHADGTLAEPPIALCEVQAYAFSALHWMANLAEIMGKIDQSKVWRLEALKLRQRFCSAFWDDIRGNVIYAIDGTGRPIRARTSNMGHCLWAGILHSHQGTIISRSLMREDLFSGHGVRTLGSKERGYNPLSYHNGSIWPHDNSIIIEGLRKYSAREEMLMLATALFDVILASSDFRLPELYCGFEKTADEEPVPYAVACKPQAWSAGSIFLILKSLLGIQTKLGEERVIFRGPILPKQIRSLEVRGLPVHDFNIDFVVRQGASSSTVELIASSGPPEHVFVIN